MKCEEVDLIMIDYLDNILSEYQRIDIEAHLSSCERCTDQMRELKTLLQLISKTEMEKPDETLTINFYHMLHSEINKHKTNNKKDKKNPAISRWSLYTLRIAAGLALLVAGAFINNLFHNHNFVNKSSSQLDELQVEVKDMKKMLLFTLLDQESPSQRIKAINYAEEIPSPDRKVLLALINTLNNDKNVNVKLAAAYSLAKFSDNPLVLDSMVASLGKQTEPVVQVVLMNLLTEKKELQAVKPMKKIISDKNTIEQVKIAAQKNIKVLM